MAFRKNGCAVVRHNAEGTKLIDGTPRSTQGLCVGLRKQSRGHCVVLHRGRAFRVEDHSALSTVVLRERVDDLIAHARTQAAEGGSASLQNSTDTWLLRRLAISLFTRQRVYAGPPPPLWVTLGPLRSPRRLPPPPISQSSCENSLALKSTACPRNPDRRTYSRHPVPES